MPALFRVSYTTIVIDQERSHLTDLTIVSVGGTDVVYGTTRLDGAITAWGITATGLTQIDQVDYDSAAQAGGAPALAQVGNNLLTSGGVAGRMVLRPLGTDGTLGSALDLGNSSHFGGPLGQTAMVETAAGTTLVYGQVTGGGGIALMTFADEIAITSSRMVSNKQAAAIDTARVAGIDYIFTATNDTPGVTAWQVRDTASLRAVSTVDVDSGLWISAPTALDTAAIDGQTYLILGSAGSNSLSVMHVGTGGALTISDHILDDRNSRFGGVTSLEVVTVGARTYVIAGGADDGVSIYQMLPGGQLLAQAHLADTTTMGLANVSDITARADGTGIDILVASGSEFGLTRLRFEVGPTGPTLIAAIAGEKLIGGSGSDMLIGGVGVDRLAGGDGDDILFDGASRDVMTGGKGADTFVLAYDKTDDVITDFDPEIDRVDLSAWPALRSLNQLTLKPLKAGILITYGEERLILTSANKTPITVDMLVEENIIGPSRLPQTLPIGFPGPVVTPVLPERPIPAPPPPPGNPPKISGVQK